MYLKIKSAAACLIYWVLALILTVSGCSTGGSDGSGNTGTGTSESTPIIKPPEYDLTGRYEVTETLSIDGCIAKKDKYYITVRQETPLSNKAVVTSDDFQVDGTVSGTHLYYEGRANRPECALGLLFKSRNVRTVQNNTVVLEGTTEWACYSEGRTCTGTTTTYATLVSSDLNPRNSEIEPNDSPATATVCAVTYLPYATYRWSFNATGSVSSTDSGTYIGAEFIQDFYKFTVTGDTKIGGYLTIGGQYADLDMYILNSAGTILASYKRDSNPENISPAVSVPAGTYYIGITGIYTPDGPVDYVLTINCD